MDESELMAARAGLFGSMFVIVQHLTRAADRELAGLGLTTRQWLLLAVLTKGFPDHSPSLSEAAEQYGTSRQNVKQIALGLESAGFVRLVTDPTDARTTRIEVTGRVRVFDTPPMLERTTDMLELVFAGLTPRQTSQLHDLAQRWLAALAVPTSREETGA
jgi:MarR family transcriptional regulator, transcriptional regulator for hemolysin